MEIIIIAKINPVMMTKIMITQWKMLQIKLETTKSGNFVINEIENETDNNYGMRQYMPSLAT